MSTAVSETRPVPPRAVVHLSEREVEVLVAWLHLDTKEAVGRRLHISVGTVNTHLTRVRVKFAAAGRPAPTKAALLARAVQDGHVDLDAL